VRRGSRDRRWHWPHHARDCSVATSPLLCSFSRGRTRPFNFKSLTSCRSPFAGSTTMSNTASEECSLENAVDIQTAYFLLNFDLARAGDTPQARQAAYQEVASLHARMPRACTDQMVASASDASLFQYCFAANSTAWAIATPSLMQASMDYGATGNRETFISTVRTTMDQCLRSLPRRCWFAPPPQSQPVPLPQPQPVPLPQPQPATPSFPPFNPQLDQLMNNLKNIATQGHEAAIVQIGNIVRR
jgi:hypothetical protein